MEQQHLLNELMFPSRYERLVDRLGTDVARLLVSPGSTTHEAMEAAAFAVRHGDEGLFCPVHALPGTGKTTLAENLSAFYPRLFTPTLSYTGDLTSFAMVAAVEAFRSQLPLNDDRVLPINIDSREALPPDAAEMASIKQFLRTSSGSSCMIVWPTTDAAIATTMSQGYEAVAGAVPIKIPIVIDGPSRDTWQGIAKDTVRFVNNVDSLDLLVNPDDYDPSAYNSIGTFLRQIGKDFSAKRLELLRSTRKPIRLTIVFASQSTDAGVLSQLTSSNRYGLLDGSALIGVTPTSEVGKWWNDRRGLLTSTIVQLEAHALALPPTVAIAVLRYYGPAAVRASLSDLGFASKGGPRALNL